MAVRITPGTDRIEAESSEGSEVVAESEPPDSQAERGQQLWYTGWNIDENVDLAKACFSFDTALAQDDRVTLQDYVEISPNVDVALSITDNRLCLSGFDYDQDYTVVLKSGLRDAKGRTLSGSVAETVSFGDKPALVRFAGDGIILPRFNGQGLAIETINVEAIEVEIARVPDRMIARRDPQTGQATPEGQYSWEYRDAATNIRESIWSGSVEIQPDKNRTVTTVLPIQEVTKDLKPGAYVVTAERKHEEDESRIARAWRWIIVTDIALTSYSGQEGLTVSARSIETARLMPGMELLLIAQNNDVLSTGKTDSQGYARFPAPILNGKGAKSPKMIMAYGKDGDYAVLDLSRTPLDLTAYDVGGRYVSGPLDIYGFPERGIYRPGETVFFTIMLRDMLANAAMDRPVKLSIAKPDGVKMISEIKTEDDIRSHAGTLTWAYDVPETAPRGVWNLLVEPEGADQVKRIEFSVEDFVPQKLKLAIKADETPIRSGEIRDVNIDAQFLYGAPGSALDGEAEARIRIDPNPFPNFEDYTFGPNKADFRETLIDMGGGATDGAGILTLALDTKNNDIQSPFPLRAEITAGISEPGGRYVRDSLFIPVRTEDIYLGIDPQFEGGRAPRRAPAKFDIIALDRDGNRAEQEITWTLVEEDWDYHWYRERNRWRYRRDVRDVKIDSGQLNISAETHSEWSRSLRWGNYRLDIRNDSGAQTSYRFAIGWGRTNQTDAPDNLQMGTGQDSVKAGEMVELTVNAPYAGRAELVIANDKIRMVKPLSLDAGPSNLSFRFDQNWGSGVYAMMTLYTPRDKVNLPVPRRAVGISYIELDRSDQTFNLEIESPDVLRPETETEIVVNVEGPGAKSGKVWLNFAAVDEGILQITKFNSPDSSGHYFGKKALSIDIRDDYGRILNPNLGDAVPFQTGGDSLGGEGLTVVPTKTVSLFSGPVKVVGGKAKIPLSLPEFNGELRLMATAWSANAVGSASRAVKLRDQVPAVIGLPRFMAPGDEAVATVSLDNVEGQAGTYSISLKSNDAITVDDDLRFELNKGERKDGKINFTANDSGISEFALDIAGPAYRREAEYPIQVRSPYLPITQVTRRLINPGDKLELSSALVSGFVPNSTDITVSFSRLPGMDATPYVKSLARYPYGCTEQTVSSAMPLLYAENLGGIPGQTEAARRQGLQKAVVKLASRQGQDGAFGLWRVGDRYGRPWLGVYVTDFLYRARDEGLYVPEDVLDRASNVLKDISQMPRYLNRDYEYWSSSSSRWQDRQRAEAAAYAHYVMARSGQGNLGNMRYFYDNHARKMNSPMAYAYIASALHLMGDERRGKMATETAVDKLGFEDDQDYYQSSVRDVSGAIAAFASAEQSDAINQLVDAFSNSLENAEYLHTNEKAHVILAFNAMAEMSDRPNVNGINARLTGSDKKPSAHLYARDLQNNPAFESRDDAPFWASISVSGSPDTAPIARENGFKLTKTLFKTDGTPADLSQISQGERFVVRLQFNSEINRSRTIVLADLLPAGFEIETILTADDGVTPDGVKGAYDWAGKISKFQVTEARDDRFVASMETYRRDEYVAAYIVRAVTPGNFAFPGAVIEDMYRPADMAITEGRRIMIAADPSL